MALRASSSWITMHQISSRSQHQWIEAPTSDSFSKNYLISLININGINFQMSKIFSVQLNTQGTPSKHVATWVSKDIIKKNHTVSKFNIVFRSRHWWIYHIQFIWHFIKRHVTSHLSAVAPLSVNYRIFPNDNYSILPFFLFGDDFSYQCENLKNNYVFSILERKRSKVRENRYIEP